MDVKRYLRDQIKKCKRKMNIAKMIDQGIWFAAAGGIGGMLCELVSLILPFYYAHLAAGLCFVIGLFAGLIYAVCKRVSMKQAARRMDSFGLKERMLTAYEQMDAEGEFAELQRQDAFVHYNQMRERIRISLLPDRRHVLALLLSAALVIGLGFIPSTVRDMARLQHQVQEQAKDEKEKLKELVDALEGVDMDSLTEEQKAQLNELMEAMKLSQEELAKANSWESFASAMEKLNYKYEQAGQSLEQLAGQLSNPEAAGLASAQALAKAAANNGGQQTASAGTPSQSSGDGESGDGSGDGDGGGDGSGDGSGDGDDLETGTEVEMAKAMETEMETVPATEMARETVPVTVTAMGLGTVRETDEEPEAVMRLMTMSAFRTQSETTRL